MKKEAISAVREAVTHELKCHHSSRAEEGKLTDEEIERMVMADLTDDAHVGLGLTHEGALAIARTFEIRGMKMARDHYLATKEDPAA